MKANMTKNAAAFYPTEVRTTEVLTWLMKADHLVILRYWYLHLVFTPTPPILRTAQKMSTADGIGLF
jgi:hypothetical protein